MRRKAGLLAVVLVAAACGGEGAESTTTAAVEQPSTTSTSSTTTTAAETTTTTVPGAVVLDEFRQNNEGTERRRLEAGRGHSLEIQGLSVAVTPPVEGWELVGYEKSGADAGASFTWRGPTGFRPGTLDVLIGQVDGGGVEAAWSRLEADPVSRMWGSDWEWVDEGVATVGGVEAEWREVRSPMLSEETGFERLSLVSGAFWIDQTSARFYVVPVDDLAVWLMGYETRCACAPKGSPPGPFNPLYQFRSQVTDDTENELSMWIPELEAFLANLSFEAP